MTLVITINDSNYYNKITGALHSEPEFILNTKKHYGSTCKQFALLLFLVQLLILQVQSYILSLCDTIPKRCGLPYLFYSSKSVVLPKSNYLTPALRSSNS